jgi:hypothetical protein
MTWGELRALEIMNAVHGGFTNDPDEPRRRVAEFMAIADRIRDERASVASEASFQLLAEKHPQGMGLLGAKA